MICALEISTVVNAAYIIITIIYSYVQCTVYVVDTFASTAHRSDLQYKCRTYSHTIMMCVSRHGMVVSAI